MPRQDPAFAKAFEQLRVARGLKPADVARELAVYPGEVSRWRRGGGISITNVRKVADFFGVERAWLEGLAGYPEGAAEQDSQHDPRLAAFIAAVEAAFRAMTAQEWDVREPAARALLSVPPTDAKTHPARNAKAPRGPVSPAQNSDDNGFHDTPQSHLYGLHPVLALSAMPA